MTLNTGHDQKLKELNLKYGAVHLIKYSNKIYGWGDFTHCNKDDIMHNIKELAKLMDKKKQLTKCYDSDIIETSYSFAQFLKDTKYCYHEQLFTIENNEIIFLNVDFDYMISKAEDET